MSDFDFSPDEIRRWAVGLGLPEDTDKDTVISAVCIVADFESIVVEAASAIEFEDGGPCGPDATA